MRRAEKPEMVTAAVIDYESGNIRSVVKMLQRLGTNVVVSSDAEVLCSADALILPGVGAFAPAMQALNQRNLVPVIRNQALEMGKPVLGICLGMQLLAKSSTEDGFTEGLGLVHATVDRLNVAAARRHCGRPLTLPHIGWNSVTPRAGSGLFGDIPPGTDFYFANSYCMHAGDTVAAATCTYGESFVCAVETGNVLGVQFHPEKSQRAGVQIMKNFVAYVQAGEGRHKC